MSNKFRFPKVAFVIVSWNNKTLLDDCIASINNQSYMGDKTIVIVDNNSNDGTAAYILDKYPYINLLPQPENHGFAKGNNIAIASTLNDSSVEYFVLLNTDARLSENWTETLIKFAIGKPKLATAQSVTLDYYNHSIIDSTHIFLSRYGQATQGSYGLPIGNNYDVPPVKVFGCNAAAMLITRKFIVSQPFTKLFDETMFMYLEDVDLAARATVMGWDNFVVPGTRAFHMGSVSSSKKDPSFSLYMTFRNNLGLLIKNMPISILLRLFLAIPRSDYQYIEHLLRMRKRRAALAVVRGRLISFFYIATYLVKRRILSKHTTVDSKYLWHIMNKGY